MLEPWFIFYYIKSWSMNHKKTPFRISGESLTSSWFTIGRYFHLSNILPANALNRNIRSKSEHVFLNRNKVNIRHMQLFNWKLKPLPLLLNQYWLWEVFFLQIIQRLTELESKRIFRISRQFFVTETLRPAPWILVIAI